MSHDDHLTASGDWLFPTEIKFGAGRLAELAQACRANGMTRPLVVTDRGLASLPLVERVLAAASRDGLRPTLFAETQENPTDVNVVEGARAYRASGSDGVIALGGGSGLDCGKAVAALAGLGGDIASLMAPECRARMHERGVAPIVSIPTTAGTGAEVEPASVITDTKVRRKRGVWHPQMLSRTVIADPELTQSLPPRLTAATAMDALIHNLEALCVPMYHPMADAMAIDGIKRIGHWLPVALEEPNNIRARAELLAASIAGATAFGKGLGAMHALSHAIGGRIGGHHGLTNAILMPHVLDFNEAAIGPALAALGEFLGLDGDKARAARRWLDDLSRRVGMPTSLRVVGVGPEHVADLAEVALDDICATTNPRKLDTEGLSGILKAAIG